MRTRTAHAITAVALLATLPACSSGTTDDAAPPKAVPSGSTPPISTPSVDCSNQGLDQATWVEHCSGETGAGGKTAGLKFGDTYTWPDGLKATVLEAKVFTDYDAQLAEKPTPGSTDFRVRVRLANTGKTAVDLSKVTMLIDGATNGGQASFTSFNKGSEPLEGRIAPGVTVTKTNDNTLETKYGRKIIVTVQRVNDELSFEFPEFSGAITS